jgi:hypothetical protein
MAMTIQQIEAFIKAAGITRFESNDHEILYSIKVNHSFKHHILLAENGELFQMYARDLVDRNTISNSPHKPLISSYLLKWAYDRKFCAPEMDDDGEIMLAVEIPLEDGTLTEKQFTRIFRVLAEQSDSLISDIRKILETGTLESGALQEMKAMIDQIALLKASQSPEFAAIMLASPEIDEDLKAKLRQLLATPQTAGMVPGSF